MAVELALFPLATVLFPHMPLALHVFEERYRTMMRDCLEQGTSFGVVAIREGPEVGPGAVPYEVGTLAQLREVHELEDGRYHLLVSGASRFRVESFSRERPYLIGSIHYLEDRAEPGGQVAGLAGALRTRFRRHLAANRTVSVRGAPEIPDEPELLSYVVAASLRIELGRRQELLEIDSVEDRLRACMALVGREAALAGRLLSGAPAAGATPLN